MDQLPYIWENTTPNRWYSYTLHRSQDIWDSWIIHYYSVVVWINTNIEGAKKHCRWSVDKTTATFRFRYERDFINFMLRWS